MRTIKIFFSTSGETATMQKDFPLYQGQYQSVLLNVYVPTNLLSATFRQVVRDGTYDRDVIPFVGGTALKCASKTIARNGQFKFSNNHYMRYVKLVLKDNIEYALFERTLPQDFTFYVGAGINAQTLIFKAVNVEFGTISSATLNMPQSLVGAIDTTILAQKVQAITQNYVFVYETNGGVGKWYRNGEEEVLSTYGITYTGTPQDDDVITLSVVASNPTTTRETTFAEIRLDVLPSYNATDNDTPIESTEWDLVEAQVQAMISVLNGKQNKDNNSNLTTTNKSIVPAINEVKQTTDSQGATITSQGLAIAQAQQDIAELKTRGTSVNYIGTMTTSTLPTDLELATFVQSKVARQPKANDMVIVVLVVSGGTDKLYQYNYNGQSWGYFEYPAIESASNDTKGIIKGSYTLGATKDVLVSIVNGEVDTIYIKDGDSYTQAKTYIDAIKTLVNQIINGTQTVGASLKATSDGLGRNIANTYLTNTTGASKQFVKDYALPKEFNSLQYFNGTNGFDDTATNFVKNVQITGVGDKQVYTSTWTPLVFKTALYPKNSIKAKYNVMLDGSVSEGVTPKLYIYADIDSDTTTLLAIQTLDAITLVPDVGQTISFETSLNQMGVDDKIVLDTDLASGYPRLRFVLIFNRSTSSTIDVNLFADTTHASYFELNTSVVGVVSATIVQGTGTSTTDAMSQNATTQFGSQTDVDLTNDDVLVSYDTTDGIQVSSVAEETRANGDVVHYNVDLKLPIVGQGMSIDKDESEEKIILKPDVRGAKLGGSSGSQATVDANGNIIIPIASASDFGVLKASTTYSLAILNGLLYCVPNNYSQYASLDNSAFVGKGTLENVLENETIRFDKSQSLSSTQKAQALSNLGGQSSIDIEVW